MRKLIYVLVLSIGCSACASYDTSEYDKLLKKQPMVLVPHTGEHSISRKPGFIIYMKPDVVDKINAPKSAEFQQLLDAQLAIEEKKNGRPFCKNGYKLVDDYVYYFLIIAAECK